MARVILGIWVYSADYPGIKTFFETGQFLTNRLRYAYNEVRRALAPRACWGRIEEGKVDVLALEDFVIDRSAQ